jgi:UPF0716 family protein affecting phage T7 exclusion
LSALEFFRTDKKASESFVNNAGLRHMRQAKDSDGASRGRRRKARNLALAIFFFIVGVIGVLVPVMPQVPFFVMSLIFLSLVFPRVRRFIRRFLHRHPRIAHAYKRWRDAARRKRRKRRREKELAAKLRLNSSSR